MARIKMKPEYLRPYQERLKELENIDNGGDPLVEMDTIKQVWELAKAWLNDMGDRTKVYEVKDND